MTVHHDRGDALPVRRGADAGPAELQDEELGRSVKYHQYHVVPRSSGCPPGYPQDTLLRNVHNTHSRTKFTSLSSPSRRQSLDPPLRTTAPTVLSPRLPLGHLPSDMPAAAPQTARPETTSNLLEISLVIRL